MTDTLHDPFANANPRIRQEAVVQAARAQDASLLDQIQCLALHDPSQEVRREAASAVGRLSRNHPQAFDILIDLSKHADPGVVIQAARGLVAARTAEQRAVARPILKKLEHHPNEVLRDFVHTERLRATTTRASVPSHKETNNWLRNIIVHGDAIQTLQHVPDDTVHLTFTSPPYYNARDYSTYPSYEHYLELLTDVFREVHRTTFEGRFLVVNTSPVIVPRAGRQHESHRFAIPFDLHSRLTGLGWKFIDDIIWKKPDGAAKPRNSGFAMHRQPLTYKSNAVTEYVMVYRKQSHRLIDWNLRQYPEHIRDASQVPDGYERTNVWELDPANDRVHSAVFPESLCERVIQYYSMVGDLILDPFAGSGTLGLAAQKLQRDFLLLELNEEYVKRIQQRCGLLGKVVRLQDWSP